MNNKELCDLIHKIRLGLEAFRDQLDSKGKYHNFLIFPKGCCGDTTMIVNHILLKKGFSDVKQVTGQKVNKLESHAWTLLNDMCIDLTADQFKGFENAKIIFVKKKNYPLNKIYKIQKISFWEIDREYLSDIVCFLENNKYL